jgi:hypothetical protein
VLQFRRHDLSRIISRGGWQPGLIREQFPGQHDRFFENPAFNGRKGPFLTFRVLTGNGIPGADREVAAYLSKRLQFRKYYLRE